MAEPMIIEMRNTARNHPIITIIAVAIGAATVYFLVASILKPYSDKAKFEAEKSAALASQEASIAQAGAIKLKEANVQEVLNWGSMQYTGQPASTAEQLKTNLMLAPWKAIYDPTFGALQGWLEKLPHL
jgi:hypothetical protein